MPDMPQFTFSIVDHPSMLQLCTNQDPVRNQHHIPKDECGGLKPILYLPPLLSSLPVSYQAVEGPFLHPPLTTETRLPEIDPASLSLHHALHRFRPIDDQYATRIYPEAFNWEQIQLPEEDGGLCMFIFDNTLNNMPSRTRMVLCSFSQFA